ncbi:MAG: helix-turn-helix domain-containing protein [Deltaproteobacteria bacterium]|nr:helix-turn-helix domain-containing protein [Deltaproteobacteria bacterium]
MKLSKKAQALRQKILLEDEIRLISQRLREVMGQPFIDLPEQYGLNLEDNLRFQTVTVRLREAREDRGMSLKDAAAALKVQQYRLRDIEDGRLKNILRDVLINYVGFLKLKRWFGRWKGANPAVIWRIDIPAISRFLFILRSKLK